MNKGSDVVKKLLNNRQTRAIELLLAGNSSASTCQIMKCSNSTLDGWLRDANFRSELSRGKQIIFDRIVSKMSSVATLAVETLEGILLDENQPAPVRANAAKIILENLNRYRLADLSDRMIAIEEQLQTSENERIIDCEQI
jgi:hypothetical protein